MILGDQGADVIKLEAPGIGDVVRLLGTARGGMSALFALLNRSKRSVVLNLRDDRGRDLMRRLVGGADVFIQNFRPGVVERLGIDEPSLREVREDLIYVSITAFGPRGPRPSSGTRRRAGRRTCATPSATRSRRSRRRRASRRPCSRASAVREDSTCG
jgi:crotonobetainyl-CoA:carnitine CoA-transferase CaiB-like acyl-CoA transferase